jgi:hypothetical protein
MIRELIRLEISDRSGSIVLYDWMEVADGRNLVRLDSDEAVVWQAQPPVMDTKEFFTRVEWEGRDLIAQTWSGFRVSVDPDTGAVTILKVTK